MKEPYIDRAVTRHRGVFLHFWQDDLHLPGTFGAHEVGLISHDAELLSHFVHAVGLLGVLAIVIDSEFSAHEVTAHLA